MKTTLHVSALMNATPNRSSKWQIAVAILSAALTFSVAATASAAPKKKAPATNIVYITSNNPTPGENAVLAFSRDEADGSLTLFGHFLTDGTGFYNSNERLGPDDSDQELIIDPDRRLLFAVNSGSDTIAVFRIHPDGSLTPAQGSPFPSGGVNPVSLGLSGNQLYVVNKGNVDPGQTPGPDAALPNYTGFRVAGNGHLSRIPHSTIEVGAGSDPTQALISPDGNLLFGSDLFAIPFPPPPGFPPFIPPFASALESFRIKPNGRLVQGPNTPQPAQVPPPFPPYILGLQVHPTERLLYVGFVAGNAMGTYSYDETGAVTFLNVAPSTGLGICWIRVNDEGTFAYTSNSTDDSISVYSLADPFNPVEVQKLDLKGPKELLGGPPAPVIFTTSPFQLSLDPSGKFLYVVNHENTVDDSFPEGNALHILQVGADGKLTETADSPLILPQALVPAGAHPKGIVVQ
ncbi:MAG TPA: beta-propeller fold lactonase family protein [Chthoniobacteraceae bacterium]|nr:beta-propeller fold lactonase family protein [Chthoniobacteraceae bacterium]